MAREIIDITVQIHAKTDRAILVSDDGHKEKAVWLPLSQVEVEMMRGGTAEITLPEWLALDKGLI